MKKAYFILAVAVVVCMISIGIVAVAKIFPVKNEKEDISYQDLAAEYGTLTVGITKTSAVSFGVAERVFDLDISALTGEPSASLQIEEVLVSAGQQVQKGTALFRVTPGSVQNVRTILQRKILDTDRDCSVLKARQKELRLQASQEYDNAIINGKYADAVYHNRCEAFQKKADDAKKMVDDKQNQLNENQLELTQAQLDLLEARKYLKEAEAAVSENYNNRYRDAYYYTTYENTMKTARNMVEQLEKQIGSLTKQNESLLYEVDEALRSYHQIAQDLEREKLAAKTEYNTEMHRYETASEWYDIQTAELDNALQEARGRRKSALQDIRTLNACIVHNEVLSGYNGVVSELMIEAGDTIRKNDRLVKIYDRESVTMEVSLSEEEYLAANLEETVKVSFADDPDAIYEGRITQVSNKEYDDRTENSFYSITVDIHGDIPGLYEGMTGNVMFSTKE